MQDSMEDEGISLPHLRQDPEFTLSSTMIYVIVLGLLVVCGFFFGLGYVVGHHFGAASSDATQAGGTTQFQAAGQAKPSATTQKTVTAPPVTQNAQTTATGQTTPTQGATPVATPTTAQVKPALPIDTAQSAATGSGSAVVKPVAATPATASYTVQIAAVAHQTDANLMIDALKKHGYAATAYHNDQDGLIHVRMGPFMNKNSADTMRQKLLSDGYNAIVQ